MEYQLAKALKDAGFPQFGEGSALVLNKPLPESDQTMSVISWRDFIRLARDENSPEFIYAPTLEELIEACGDKFGRLRFDKWDNHPELSWSAGGGEPNYEDEWEFDKTGTSSTEAVAKLWLALHKHD